MKPTVIFINKKTNKNNNYTFTPDELKELLEDVYQQGYNKGKSEVPPAVITYPTGWKDLNEPWSPNTTPNPDWTKITCTNDSGSVTATGCVGLNVNTEITNSDSEVFIEQKTFPNISTRKKEL